MKLFALCLITISCLSFNAVGQINITKPKIEVKKPNIELGKKGSEGSSGSGNSSSSGGTSVLSKSDPSGLFDNVSEDPSAELHRKRAVENLEGLEAEFKKETVDYIKVDGYYSDAEQRLGFIAKLEPGTDATKFRTRYAPSKERAVKELEIYSRVKTLEAKLQNNFRTTTFYSKDESIATKEFKTPNPLTFRVPGYGVTRTCYCRDREENTSTYTEFENTVNEYDELKAQLAGYNDAVTNEFISTMNECVSDGNKYAVWASSEQLQVAVVNYGAENKIANPKEVIKRCEEYTAGLDAIATDYSLNLDQNAKNALEQGKSEVAKVRSESELYISSGEYQKYLDKVHAEEIAKVFMPKAATKNATMEAGAMKYIKGEEYGNYLKNSVGISAVSSTIRAVSLSGTYMVHKNEFGIPEYQYKEYCVAYKDVEGKCYKVAVYASYTYKGGGVYDTIPNWSADSPEELSCDNVNK